MRLTAAPTLRLSFLLVAVITSCQCQSQSEIDSLIHSLRSGNAVSRWYAARRLGEIGSDADAFADLIKLLKDEKSYVRASAASALGDIGPDAKDAVSDLIRLLNDEESGVCMSAASALGRIGPDAKDAVPDLIKLLKDEEVDVRASAASALGAMAEDFEDSRETTSIPHLEKALAALVESDVFTFDLDDDGLFVLPRDRVKRAITALTPRQQAPWTSRIAGFIKDHPWTVVLLSVIAAYILRMGHLWLKHDRPHGQFRSRHRSGSSSRG